MGAMHPLRIWMHPLGICKSIKGEYAHQPAKEYDIPHNKNVFPLLNHRGWEQLIFKTVCIYKIFVLCYRVQ